MAHTKDAKRELNLSQLWLRHSVYWPYFLILLLLSISIAWGYLYYTPPIYEANARMLVKDENKGAEDSKSLEFLRMASSKKLLENEKEVISSKKILNDVVKTLNLYAPIYKKDKFISRSAYTYSPVKIEAKNPDKLATSGSIDFTYNPNGTVVINNKVFPLYKWLTNKQDTFRFIKNHDYIPNTNNDFSFRFIAPHVVTQNIKAHLTVEPISKSATILNINYTDEVPERAEDILNEMIEAYNLATIKDKNNLAANTLKFVQNRLDQVSKNLDSVENEIKRYKSNSGAFDIGTQSQLYLKNVSDNDQKLSDINMKLAVLNQVQEYVLSKNNKAGIVPSTLGVDDPILTSLLTLLYEAELNYEKLKNTEGENSPALASITLQINRIRPGILENIQNQRRSLLASKNNLQNTNNLYTSALTTIPNKEKEIVSINREQSIISSIYSFLLQKKEEAVLSYASTIPNSIIIDKAEASSAPISPKPMKLYMLALVVPMIIGVGTITIKESFSSKVLFRKEIEDLTTYPIIGEISNSKIPNPVSSEGDTNTFISEQFRQLRVAITLNKNNQGCNRILVTSTISGEGKSFIALNLASMFALNDKKTVLLELDLNNPTISNTSKVANSPGISELLQGVAEKEDIIKRSAVTENLFIIPAGTPPKIHPSELIENGKIQDFLSYLSEIFDYIIIDTAPVSNITDAYILCNSCHLTLYVIRHNYTPKIYLERLDQNNKLSNISIVFNGIQPRGFGKHHYGYGYGYGYVYNEKKKLLKQA